MSATQPPKTVERLYYNPSTGTPSLKPIPGVAQVPFVPEYPTGGPQERERPFDPVRVRLANAEDRHAGLEEDVRVVEGALEDALERLEDAEERIHAMEARFVSIAEQRSLSAALDEDEAPAGRDRSGLVPMIAEALEDLARRKRAEFEAAGHGQRDADGKDEPRFQRRTTPDPGDPTTEDFAPRLTRHTRLDIAHRALIDAETAVIAAVEAVRECDNGVFSGVFSPKVKEGLSDAARTLRLTKRTAEACLANVGHFDGAMDD